MQASKTKFLLASVALNCWLFPGPASAGDKADNCATTNAPGLKAVVNFEGGPGRLPTHVAYVTAGTNKFGFLVPEGYRLNTSDPQKLVLVSADLNSLITWRIVGPAPTNRTELDAADYRAMLSSRHPGGKIVEEFSLATGVGQGPALELRWSGPGGLERRQLAVFVASPWGVLEFNLDSSLEKFGIARQQLNSVMLTFRASDAEGKLEMPVFSNRI